MTPTAPDAHSLSSYDDKTQVMLRSAQAGDRPALEALFERVAPMLLSWAHLRMSPAFRQKVDPHDVIQEVWLRAMQRFSELDPRTTTFRAWIFRVAHFVVIEMSRDLLRGNGAKLQSASSLFTAQLSPESGASTKLVREEAVQNFVELVGGLKRENRELVVLRGLEGCPFDEVAQRLGGKAAAWEKRWQRLRARIPFEPVLDYPF